MTMTTTPTMTEEAPRLPFAGALAAAELEADSAGLPEWVLKLRRAARERYLALGLPTRRHEEWRYTSLRALKDTVFALEASQVADEFAEDGVKSPHPRPFSLSTISQSAAQDARDLAQIAPWIEPTDVALVFVDGVLSTAMTRLPSLGAGITVSTIGAALTESLSAADFESEALTDDPFLALNLAFLGRAGAYIDIAAHADPSRIIHLVHMSSTPRVAAFPRHVIRLARGARASIVESVVGAANGSYFVGSVSDLRLGEGAALTHARVQAHAEQGIELGMVRAKLERDAQLDSFVYTSGGTLIRDAANIELTGEGAAANFSGLALLRADEHIASRTFVDHQVPNASSNQLYKAILAGNSRGVFDGLIHVRQDAQGSAARQQSRALMLSPDAEFDAKPQLLIDADDVKCSHGAAIGRLRDDELFYLQSRGLPEANARALLALAFAQDALLRLSLPSLRKALRARSVEWLSQ